LLDNELGEHIIRQIEVIRDEILGSNNAQYKEASKTGIICPYRKQVTETNMLIGKDELEVDTSNKVFKQHGTNIGDLIRYIQYNSFDNAVIESKKVSVFDLLYSEYSEKLLNYRTHKKRVSEYESENLMYGVIEEVLSLPKYNSFKCVLHVPLKYIVKDFNGLKSEESKFAQNPWTHVDFLIFNKLDKDPELVVEVDGHEFHRNNEKQRARDSMKDKILEHINLPILRVATNESGERERLIRKLDEIINLSAQI
jgi:very-short-patch-repair endonuclease